LHLSDIPLPKGVELVELTHGDGHDTAIVNIHVSRAAVESEEEGEAEVEAPESEGGE
jgi:large subunit ribosomal protein L25